MATATAGPPRKWLMDRISGDSKYGDRERPWCPCCWVAPPVGWCPSLLEECGCCKFFGKIGIYTDEQPRFYLMHLGFMINTIAMFMVVYACLAISDDYEVLSKASFSKITMQQDIGDTFPAGTTVHVGLRAISWLTSDDKEEVVNFDQFCATSGMDKLLNPEDCSSCQDMSLNFVMSTILAAVLFLPSLFVTVSRMYSGYDVNCGKAYSSVLAICSLGLCLNTLWTFKYFCGDKFYRGLVPIDDEGNPFPEDITKYADYVWEWGWGVIFLVAGVVLKGLEMMINCCVATPSITRDRKEQQIYENIKDEEE